MFVRQNSHIMETNQEIWILGHKGKGYPISGDYDLMYFESPPRSQGPPPHVHATYDESFLIVEGEMEFVIDGDVQVLKAGESIDVPKGTLHTFGNASELPCKWINIHSPKGFSEFFDTFGVPDTQEDAVANSLAPECIQQVLQRAGEFDMRLVMPSGTE